MKLELRWLTNLPPQAAVIEFNERSHVQSKSHESEILILRNALLEAKAAYTELKRHSDSQRQPAQSRRR